MIITTTVEIPPRRIADLMVTAIEGGIGYWCKSVKLVGQPMVGLKQIYQEYAIDAEVYPSLTIVVADEDDKRHVITIADMELAFLRMQEFGKPKGFHWRDFLSENEDATTADVWFQLAVFGEVVYG